MNRFLFIILGLLSLPLAATEGSYSGEWLGSGEVLENAAKTNCSEFYVNLTEDDKAILVNEIRITCSNQVIPMEKWIRFGINQGGLYLDGKKVGTWGGGKISLSIPSDNSTVPRETWEFLVLGKDELGFKRKLSGKTAKLYQAKLKKVRP